MVWERQNYTHTLYIENVGSAKKPKYKLQQMIGILTNDGVSYLEPMPLETVTMRDISFDNVVFIDTLGVRKNTQLELTHSHSNKGPLIRSGS